MLARLRARIDLAEVLRSLADDGMDEPGSEPEQGALCAIARFRRAPIPRGAGPLPEGSHLDRLDAQGKPGRLLGCRRPVARLTGCAAAKPDCGRA